MGSVYMGRKKISLNIDEIATEYCAGKSLAQLAPMHGCSPYAIARCLNEKGIIRRSIPSVRERFWERVSLPFGTTDDDCWEWIGRKGRRGYGVFGSNSKRESAHRLSYRLHRGAIPRGLLVCHHCDCPSCVNPHHLFVGTHSDNIRDACRKGRPLRGSRHPRAKITEANAIQIREQFKAGTSAKMLGKAFGISEVAVRAILSRRNWRHV